MVTAVRFPAGLVFALFCFAVSTPSAYAALTLTSGNNATTTPSVATSITGFQIVGPAASTTPVKLRATSGTLNLSVVSGVTMSGNNSGTVNLSGTVTNLNTALSTLTYTRASTGTDTLEVSLVNSGEVFFTDNGHLYQFVSGSLTWSQAKSAAAALSAYGATGYLATITSSDENSFVYARISGDGWLSATDAALEKTWVWDAGPESGTSFFLENGSGGGGSAISGRYNRWASGEPNDFGGAEDCGYMYASQSGQWNDFPCSAQQGYVAEFGAPGNLPVVVATNISVVTADVPAVTSLSPANASTSVSTSANLVIGFSKTVTKQTGNIVIRRSSDNSVVESIDASGSQLSGTGTNTITIDPSTLPEGVQLYVTVPGTAFKDSSNNFFDGIIASTTWVFTTSDITAPAISNIQSTTGTSTATLTWDTNESASTRLWYSANNTYSSSTGETDTSPRVTSHSTSLSGLIACTLYNFKVVSRDASANAATSSSSTFTTTGCAGGGAPTSATSTPVTVSAAATSTLTDASRTLSVVTPANFTATSSSIIIQIKGLDSTTVLGSIGKPSNSLTSAASIVFNVTALINNVTELDSFDTPVTVSYTYTDADVSGITESSLAMYHYKNSAWEVLNNCSVDTAANTITCNAPHFSIFAIFGTPPVANTASAGAGGSGLPWCSGPSAPGWNSSLPDGGCGAKLASAQTLLAPTVVQPQTTTQTSQPPSGTSCPGYNFTRTLRFGTQGEDVRALQKLLNCLGFSLGANGPGALGEETIFFVARTRAALIKFQEAYTADVLVPISATKGTGIFAEFSRKKVQALTSGN